MSESPARGAAAERWSLPSIDGPIMGGRRVTNDGRAAGGAPSKAEQARGYEAGIAAARAEMQSQLAGLEERIQRLDAIFATLARPLEELDAAVQEQLTLLALAIGKQLARRELRADPTQIVAIIREAVTSLPIAARNVHVQLHPEDAALVRERLATPGLERAWSIIEDPTLARGGCLVRAESSQIDARLEARVNAIVSAILGEERTSERVAEPPPAAPGA